MSVSKSKASNPSNEPGYITYDVVPVEAQVETAIDPLHPSPIEPQRPRRRGRYQSIKRPSTSPDLFPDKKTDRMASNKVIWEGCNILSQGRNAGWIESDQGSPFYKSLVAKGKGYVSFWLTNDLHVKNPTVLEEEAALALIDQFDIRAACLHLIYAAHATQLERPWEQHFVLSDRQLERYLGLDKNKKLNKRQKLDLMLELAKQPCHLLVYVSWPEKGKVKSFSVSRTWLWEISEPILHFQEDLSGQSDMVGFTLQIKAGNWAQYFLNPDRCMEGSGYYEYGILSQSILRDLMSIWYNHESAARLILWLLFKTKVSNSPIRVSTLLKVAFGEDKVEAARTDSVTRKRLVAQWKKSLQVMDEQGWKFTFDAATYPPQYLPDIPDLLPLRNIPDDPEQAIEFWMEDASRDPSEQVTTFVQRPYGGFEQLLTARMIVQPPDVIAQKLEEGRERKASLSSVTPTEAPAKSRKSSRKVIPSKSANTLPIVGGSLSKIESGEQLRALRLTRGLTQSALAERLGKSTSWVKLVETGRRNITPQDQHILVEILQPSA